MGRLENKVAVITGAASGMGKAMAVLFAREGAKVVAADLNLDGAKTTAQEITQAGGTCVALACNVAEQTQTNALIDQTVEVYGTVDILVNNAGIMDSFEPVHEVTDEKWDRVFAVNTTGTMHLCRKVIPIFREKKSGAIINIASVGGLFGSRAGAAYTASKHAVVGLTKSIGYMYAPEGIRCNAIAPGSIATNIGTSITGPSEYGSARMMPGVTLSPPPGKSEEVAEAALFLASDEASFVNGTVLTVDGGWTAY
ncbi:MAG: SDR family oxidoreductase [Actinomycetaceae bacterium]|nr:SDR family oxidoreductase [Actinomycetaceae bacterium]